jgi:hypothetical protein
MSFGVALLGAGVFAKRGKFDILPNIIVIVREFLLLF